MSEFSGQDVVYVRVDPEASGFAATIETGSGEVRCTTDDGIPVTLVIASITHSRPDSSTLTCLFNGTYTMGDVSGNVDGYYSTGFEDGVSYGLGGLFLT